MYFVKDSLFHLLCMFKCHLSISEIFNVFKLTLLDNILHINKYLQFEKYMHSPQ